MKLSFLSLLSTITPNGAGGEVTEYNHPDRLGARLITNQTLGTVSEQAHLPFGRPLNAESSLTTNNRRFTSYDRSAATGLDYAINRTYDSKLGRFMQVDPIGMQAISLASPQTLNMYAYCGNDPINHVDPAGLFFGKLFKWLFKAINKILKWVVIAVVAILVVAAIVYTAGGAMPAFLGGGNGLLGILGSIAGKIGAGISSFMAGAIGVEVGAAVGGSIAAALYGVGAIANNLQTRRESRRSGIPTVDQLVRGAVNRALKLLRNARCRRAILDGAGGRERNLPGSGDPREVLETILNKKNIVHNPTMGGIAAGGRGEDPTGYIRFSNVFLRNPNNYRLNRPRPSLSNQDARALIVLHELRHIVTDSGHTDSSNSDEVYNDRILRECFGR